MRLAAQERLGFYPAKPEAIEALLTHIVISDPEVHIIDPCAGQGAAIKQIAEGLSITHDKVYCVELDPDRGRAIHEAMPDAHVLAPCSFMSVYATHQTFGLCYVNPPFDDELGGGGREEEAFARRCYHLLPTNGVMVLVAPFQTFKHYDLVGFLDGHFKDAALYSFPEAHRPYNECAFIGLKRAIPLVQERTRSEGYLGTKLGLTSWRGGCHVGFLAQLGQLQFQWSGGLQNNREESLRSWSVPKTWKPHKFVKIQYTDPELAEAITRSPLNRLVSHVEEPAIKEPPLPLDRGHVAMLLASGALDGLVETPHGNHVVRGVATKVEVYNEEASDYTVSDDGETAKIKEVWSQQITLKVRAVDALGTIHTFTACESASNEEKVEEVTLDFDSFELIKKLEQVTVSNGATRAEEEQAEKRIAKLKARAKKSATSTTRSLCS